MTALCGIRSSAVRGSPVLQLDLRVVGRALNRRPCLRGHGRVTGRPTSSPPRGSRDRVRARRVHGHGGDDAANSSSRPSLSTTPDRRTPWLASSVPLSNVRAVAADSLLVWPRSAVTLNCPRVKPTAAAVRTVAPREPLPSPARFADASRGRGRCSSSACQALDEAPRAGLGCGG